MKITNISIISALIIAVNIVHVMHPSVAFSAEPKKEEVSAEMNVAPIRIDMVDRNLQIRQDFVVSPTKFVQILKPGTEGSFNFGVTNREGQEMTYEVFVQDFAPSEEVDDIMLYTEKDGPFSARSWFHVQPEFTLKHGERATLTVEVRVPKLASVGDHYSALIIRRKNPPDKGAGINLVTQVGVLVLITADGNTVKNGAIETFFSNDPIYWSRVANLTLRYKNTGTVHLAPNGSVFIKNMFGVVVDQIPLRDWFVYRESSRSRTLTWQPRFALGRYTANLEFSDAAHPNEPVKAVTSFWVIPWIPLLIAVGTVFFLSLLAQIIISRFEIRKKDDAKKEETKE